MDSVPAPQISIVTAMYNTRKYLTRMLDSVARQTVGASNIEIIIVDDGSSDGSVEHARAEIERLGLRGVVLEQEHKRQAVARNRGMDVARGEWINFLDSDDWLAPNFFERQMVVVDAAAVAGCSVNVVVGHPVFHYQSTGRTLDLHPLTWRYSHGDVVLDLDKDPNFIHLQCGPITMRRQFLVDHGLRFDPRVVPTYEDAHFFNRVLLHCDRPLVGYVASALYYYLKREDSSVAGAYAELGRYIDTPKYGHLALVEEAQELRGDVPAWITASILYDEGWVLHANDELSSRTDWLSPTQREAYCTLMEEIFRHCVAADIWEQYFAHVSADMRAAILASSQGFYDSPDCFVRRPDPSFPGLDRVTYRFSARSSTKPREEVWVDGRKIEDYESGTQRRVYFGALGFCERTIFVPQDTQLRLALNGVDARPVDSLTPEIPQRSPSPHPIVVVPEEPRAPVVRAKDCALRAKKRLGAVYRAARKDPLARWVAYEVQEYLSRTNGRGVPSIVEQVGRSKFAAWPKPASIERAQLLAEYSKPMAPHGAWVLYDSFERADDNAEHLTRYLLRNRPDINVVYLLDRESQDWDRLVAEGFPLLPTGTTAAIDAIHHAAVLLSSHADVNKEKPVARTKRPGKRRTPFVFLQHGVIQNDLSQWLNPKAIDLILTSTKQEYRALTTSPLSPYASTTLSASLTGLPRWDALQELAENASGAGETRWVTLMPTWRRDLVIKLSAMDDPRARAEAFRESAYLAPWRELLDDRRLQETLAAHDLKIRMIIHPSLSRVVDVRQAFPGGEVLSYNDISIQSVLAESDYVITENSSIAFDAALIGCRIAYLNQGIEDIYSGSHMYRQGYFEYSRDGFGPVVPSAQELGRVLSADIAGARLDGVLLPGDPVYAERAARVFAVARSGEGTACGRAVAAVERLLRLRGGALPESYLAP